MGLFDRLRKKEEEFPSELPPLPPLPPVQPIYPAPPQQPVAPAYPQPPEEEPFFPESPEELELPPLEEPMEIEPEPEMPPEYQTPFKQQMPEIELPRPEIKPMRPEVFIKIDKYREIMRNVSKVKEELAEVQADMNELGKLDNEEKEKISAGQAVLDRINKMVLFLDETFTSAE